MAKKIIITGATGAIARNLTAALLQERKHELLLVSRHADMLRHMYAHHTGVKTADNSAIADAQIDMRDTVCMHTAFPRTCDCADIAGALEFQRVVARRMKQAAGRLIVLSSESVYGAGCDIPVSETSPCCPANPYAVGKYAGEMICREIFDSVPDRLLVIRLGSVCGPERFLAKFVSSALAGRALHVTAPHSLRSLTDPKDVTRALMACISSENSHGTYNFSTGEFMTVLEAARMARDMCALCRGSAVNIEVSERERTNGMLMNSGRFMKEFGIEAIYGVRDMVATLIDEMK